MSTTLYRDEEAFFKSLDSDVERRKQRRRETVAEAERRKSKGREIPKVVGLYGNCKCGSGNINYIVKQTRSRDEASTVFFSCGNCADTWKG